MILLKMKKQGVHMEVVFPRFGMDIGIIWI